MHDGPSPSRPSLAEAWRPELRRRWLVRISLVSSVLLPLSVLVERRGTPQPPAAFWSTAALTVALAVVGLSGRWRPRLKLGPVYAGLLALVGLRNTVYVGSMAQPDALLVLQLFTAGLFALMLAPSLRSALVGPAALVLAPLALAPWLMGRSIQLDFAVPLLCGGAAISAMAWTMARWQQEALWVRRQVAFQARHDGLTGLLKRQALFDAAHERRAVGLGVVLLDIDHFKLINDRYSHQMGDQVLAELAAAIRRDLPEGGLAGRLGGEEFVVVLPGGAEADCHRLAKRLRHKATRLPSTPITLSQGVSVAPPGEGLTDALKQADSAMYAAKRGGRNSIRLAGEASWGGAR